VAAAALANLFTHGRGVRVADFWVPLDEFAQRGRVRLDMRERLGGAGRPEQRKRRCVANDERGSSGHLGRLERDLLLVDDPPFTGSSSAACGSGVDSEGTLALSVRRLTGRSQRGAAASV
jgi:hypothetical protein